MVLKLGLGSSPTEKGVVLGATLVDVTPVEKIHRVRSDVCHRQPDGADLPLQRHVPLLEIWDCSGAG